MVTCTCCSICIDAYLWVCDQRDPKKKEIIGDVSDGGRDEPDERDYVYEEVFWSGEVTEKVKFPKEHLIVQDQSKDKKTRMACTRFWMTHIHNAQQIIEHWPNYTQLIAKTVWEEYLKDNPKAEQDGATLQSVLNQFKKLWLITWYAKCVTDEARKQAIDRWQWILTGALYWDWIYVRDHAEYRDRTDGKEAGHIFSIVWYNDIGWIALNSFWPNNGYFTIPYLYTSSLYSTYAIIDKDEKGELQAHKDKLLLEEAKRLWIWNGNNPKMNISREDTVLMLMRSRNIA